MTVKFLALAQNPSCGLGRGLGESSVGSLRSYPNRGAHSRFTRKVSKYTFLNPQQERSIRESCKKKKKSAQRLSGGKRHFDTNGVSIGIISVLQGDVNFPGWQDDGGQI